ncbi:MAG: cadmium-translocating P-type ATPase [Betaproteobacteria bacterium]|nr:MAG: cadmium-translocating P-type ATPase [Betaproteobacteria bacterium]
MDCDRFTHWPAERDGVRVAESSLRIGGMHCAACATTIEQALSRVDGVVDARVSAAAQYALVRWDPARTRASALANAVTALGYDAVPDTAAGARALRRREARVALWRLFVAALCAMQVMMLATPSYVSAPGELSSDLAQLLAWGSWLLTLPVMVFSAAPFFIGAWRSISQRRIGMDVPVALGIAVAFVASSGAAFDPAGVFGHEVYFDSLTMFIAFLLGGRYLEMRARHRAAISLENTLGSLPQTVMRVAADGSVESVSAQQLLRGDIVRVPVGQAFAADGILTQGRTQADESLLSGESIPLTKNVGDPVIAGSTNLLAPVLMRVERLGADTRYEAIVALMRRAQTQRPASVAAADRWATPFLWAVLLLAGGAAAFWSAIDPARAVWVAVSVLIVTCPCALSLAAPSAMLAATSAMARRGVLLRRLQAIEGLTRMQTLFIDKTGTLTEATLRSVQLQCVNADCSCSDADLRRIAASLGGWSTHPLARMLAASTERATIEWRDVVEVAGRGMQGTASDGAVWRLGAASWAGTTGLADIDSNAASWLSRDGVCVARFSIEDSLRADAAQAVRALQADGVRIALISGDDPRRVDRIGRSLGVDDCAGGLSPEGKLSVLRAAQQRGEIVAMVGDGINDAPVLAQADVSLAMGEGALVARTQADGVLISNKLDDLVRARALARKTLRVVRQNIAWAAGYNAACVPLALVGWLPPWAAGLGMATSSLVVVLNSLRLARD